MSLNRGETPCRSQHYQRLVIGPRLKSSRTLMNDLPLPISSEFPDWTREKPTQFWDPGRKLLRAIRRYQYWKQRPGFVGNLLCKVLVLRHRFWSVVTGADIPLNCQI